MNSCRMLTLAAFLVPLAAHGQERPSFVTYNHHMEEPGALEVGLHPLFGTQRGSQEMLAHAARSACRTRSSGGSSGSVAASTRSASGRV